MKPDNLARQHASDGHALATPGSHGNTDRDEPGITLAIRRDCDAVQIALRPGSETAVAKQLAVSLGILLPTEPGDVHREGELSAFHTAPGRWLIEGHLSSGCGLMESVAGALEGFPTYLTDMGNSVVIYELSGPDVRRLLAKGSSVDFHPSAFPSDRFAQTSWAGCHVLIDCRETDRFRVHVSRSYAVHLLEALAEAALEYRLTIAETGT